MAFLWLKEKRHLNLQPQLNNLILEFMRKHLFLLLFALSLSMGANASHKIPFVTGIVDDIPIGHGHGKSSMRPPVVYIEDYTLSFVADNPEVYTEKNNRKIKESAIYFVSLQSKHILQSVLI